MPKSCGGVGRNEVKIAQLDVGHSEQNKTLSRWPLAARRGMSGPRSPLFLPPGGVIQRAVKGGVLKMEALLASLLDDHSSLLTTRLS